jgi:hypothetical protein
MKKFMKTRAQLINEMKIILLYEMNHEIEGLFHDVHLGGLNAARRAYQLSVDIRMDKSVGGSMNSS